MSSKKKKLTLKKTQAKKDSKAACDVQGNTILSMFQKQEVQREKKMLDRCIESEGSEGDVIITKIITSDSGSILTGPASVPSSRESSKKLPVRDANLQKKHISKTGLSLSKTRKRKSKTANDPDSSDEEFTDRKRTFKPRYENESIHSNNSPVKYNLRQHKSVPITLDSDSDNVVNMDDSKTVSRSKSNIETCSADTLLSEHKLTSSGKKTLSLRKSKSDDKSLVSRDISHESDKKDIIEHRRRYSRDSKPEHMPSPVPKTSTTNKESSVKSSCSVTEVPDSVNTLKPATCNNSDIDLLHTDKMEVISGSDVPEPSTSDKPAASSVPFNWRLKQAKDLNGNTLKTKRTKQKLISEPEPSTSSLGSTEGHDDTMTEGSQLDTGGLIVKDETSVEGGEPTFRVPYYLENFRTILESVIQYDENSRLFNEADKTFISTFNDLDEPAQKLYVRLFSRKLSWLPMNKLNYLEISENIGIIVDILADKGFLILGDELTDLEVALNIIAAPDLKSVAKSFHLNITGATKPKIVEMLMKKSRQSAISTMFTGGGGVNTAKTMLTRAKSYLGKACRLVEGVRAVFIRLMMLFSLFHTNYDEESGGGGQNQLFQMLMANIGRVVYPVYTVNHQTPVFQDRDSLIRFEKALQLEVDLHSKIDRGKWLEAYEVYKQAKEVGDKILHNEKFIKWDGKLPEFLCLYTAGSVYTRLDNQGVEILQRLKKYADAVTLLEDLLAQKVYCRDYRGHWYERLALNLDAHLKNPSKSLDVIREGLEDPLVKVARRLAIYQRAEKLCNGPNCKFAHRMAEFQHDDVIPAPEHYVEGMVMPDATAMGIKYQFVMSGGEDGVTMCGVEELVLEYYKDHGFPDGLHAEGSIISNLFCLCFWDIIYMDVHDVFHGPFQTQPLDMATTDFYRSRKAVIDDRLDWIKDASDEVLQTEVGTVWENHSGTMSAGINWDKFTGPQTHQGLVSCMGGRVIGSILERYVKNPRHTRSGFPDLTLWNTDTKTFKISEVKGPGDRLSHKQILWLDYLLKQGVDAEVCYVKGVGSKKLKPTAK